MYIHITLQVSVAPAPYGMGRGASAPTSLYKLQITGAQSVELGM